MGRVVKSSGIISRFILLSDIVSSSRLHELYPRDYSAALDRHNELIEQTVVECGGEIFKSTGDGYYSFFFSSYECIACATKLATEFAKFPDFEKKIMGGSGFPGEGDLKPANKEAKPTGDPFLVRIVAHHGEMRAEGAEFFGPALNRASRLCQVCHPQQIILSEPAKPSQQDLPEGVTLTDLGEHHLRDLAKPEHLYQLNIPGLLHKFPALATLKNRPNNLIELPNAFIGRERELGELSAILADQRLVSIIAPGGYGKSRISAQLCANLLDSFERGVFFVELAPLREHTDIASALANATGFQFYGSRDPNEQLIDFLREKEMLLCFDNFEHVLEGAPFIANIFKEAPGVKAIVTSREPLRIAGERVYKLQPLPIADEHSEAVMLFADRATLVCAGFVFDVSLAKEICSLLSGIPLAIELAAAWMDSFTLAELREELGEQLELTARMSDVPERHRSLRASLDWSWNLLDGDHRKMLMALSTFRGGCFADAAAAVLQMKGMKLRGGLAKLVDKSWLYTRNINGKTRFYLRDAVSREFAFEKLKEAGNGTGPQKLPASLYEVSVLAHAKFFSELINQEGGKLHGQGQMEAFHVVGLEKQNIYEAVDSILYRLGNPSSGLSTINLDPPSLLFPIVRWLWEFLGMASDFQELVERYQVIEEATAQADDMQQVQLWAMLGLSRGLRRLSDYETTRSNAQLAGVLAGKVGDRGGQAMSLNELGAVESDQGNYGAARKLYSESLAIRRGIEDRAGIATSLNNLGILEKSQGNYGAARELYSESLAIYREIGDRYGIAISLPNHGVLERIQGNHARARELFNESLEIKREIFEQRGIAVLLQNLGIIERLQGNHDASRSLFNETLAINREIGDRNGIASSLGSLGILEYSQSNLDDARKLLVESLDIRREIGNRAGIANSLNNLGLVEYCQGNHEIAHGHLSESLDIRCGIGDRHGICELLVATGCLLATTAQAQAGAVCLYGAQCQANKLGFTFDPVEGGLLKEGLAIIEHPDTGLPHAERDRLIAQAESMSLDGLAEFALEQK